jgi:hypothetical protein
MKARTLLTVYVPLIIIAYIMNRFSDNIVIKIINYTFYVFGFYNFFMFFKIRQAILKRFPDYYKSIYKYKFQNGPEPLYYKYRTLVHKSQARYPLNRGFWRLGILMIIVALIFKLNFLSLGILLLASSYLNTKRVTQPPIALYLSTSNADSFRLFKLLNTFLRPEKITCLLKLPFNNNITDRALLQDYLRTRDDAIWKETVNELYIICKFIIVDARFSSEAVQHELDTINNRNLWNKTLIISGTKNEQLAWDDFCQRSNKIEPALLFKGKITDAEKIIKPNSFIYKNRSFFKGNGY